MTRPSDVGIHGLGDRAVQSEREGRILREVFVGSLERHAHLDRVRDAADAVHASHDFSAASLAG